jgi:hypothetical protein
MRGCDVALDTFVGVEMLHDIVRREAVTGGQRRRLVTLSGMKEVLERINIRDEHERLERETAEVARQEDTAIREHRKMRRAEKLQKLIAEEKDLDHEEQNLKMLFNLKFRRASGPSVLQSETTRRKSLAATNALRRASMMATASDLPPLDADAATSRAPENVDADDSESSVDSASTVSQELMEPGEQGDGARDPGLEERQFVQFLDFAKRGDPGWVDMFLDGPEARDYKAQIHAERPTAVLSAMLGSTAPSASAGEGTARHSSAGPFRAVSDNPAKDDVDNANTLIEEILSYTSPSLILASRAIACPHCTLLPDVKVRSVPKCIYTGALPVDDRIPPNVRPMLYESLDKDMWAAAVHLCYMSDADLTAHIRRAADSLPSPPSDDLSHPLHRLRTSKNKEQSSQPVVSRTNQTITTLAKILSNDSSVLGLKPTDPNVAEVLAVETATTHAATSDQSPESDSDVIPGQAPSIVPPQAVTLKRTWLLRHRFATTLELSVWQAVLSDLDRSAAKLKATADAHRIKMDKKVHTALNELGAVTKELARLHASLADMDDERRKQIIRVASLEQKVLESEKRYHVLNHTISKGKRTIVNESERVEFLKEKVTSLVAQHSELNRVLAVAAGQLRQVMPVEVGATLDGIDTRAALFKAFDVDFPSQNLSTAKILLAGKRGMPSSDGSTSKKAHRAQGRGGKPERTPQAQLSADDLIKEKELRERFLGRICDNCGLFHGSSSFCPRTGIAHEAIATSYFQQSLFKPAVGNDDDLPVSITFVERICRHKSQDERLTIQPFGRRSSQTISASSSSLGALEADFVVQRLFPNRLPRLSVSMGSAAARSTGNSNKNQPLADGNLSPTDSRLRAFDMNTDAERAARVAIHSVYHDGSSDDDALTARVSPPEGPRAGPDEPQDDLQPRASYASWRQRRRERKVHLVEPRDGEEPAAPSGARPAPARVSSLAPPDYLALLLRTLMQMPSPAELHELSQARRDADPQLLRCERNLRGALSELRGSDVRGDGGLSMLDAQFQERELRRDIAAMTDVLNFAHVPPREMLLKASDLEKSNTALESKLRSMSDRNTQLKSDTDVLLGRTDESSSSKLFDVVSRLSRRNRLTMAPRVEESDGASPALAVSDSVCNAPAARGSGWSKVASLIKSRALKRQVDDAALSADPIATHWHGVADVHDRAAIDSGSSRAADRLDSVGPSSPSAAGGVSGLTAALGPAGHRFGRAGGRSPRSTPMPDAVPTLTMDFDGIGPANLGVFGLSRPSTKALVSRPPSTDHNRRRPKPAGSRQASMATTPSVRALSVMGSPNLDVDFYSTAEHADRLELEVENVADELRAVDVSQALSPKSSKASQSTTPASSPKATSFSPNGTTLHAVAVFEADAKRLQDALDLRQRVTAAESRRLALLHELRSKHEALVDLRQREVATLHSHIERRVALLYGDTNCVPDDVFDQRVAAATRALAEARERLETTRIGVSVAADRLTTANVEARNLAIAMEQLRARRSDGSERLLSPVGGWRVVTNGNQQRTPPRNVDWSRDGCDSNSSIETDDEAKSYKQQANLLMLDSPQQAGDRGPDVTMAKIQPTASSPPALISTARNSPVAQLSPNHSETHIADPPSSVAPVEPAAIRRAVKLHVPPRGPTLAAEMLRRARVARHPRDNRSPIQPLKLAAHNDAPSTGSDRMKHPCVARPERSTITAATSSPRPRRRGARERSEHGNNEADSDAKHQEQQVMRDASSVPAAPTVPLSVQAAQTDASAGSPFERSLGVAANIKITSEEAYDPPTSLQHPAPENSVSADNDAPRPPSATVTVDVDCEGRPAFAPSPTAETVPLANVDLSPTRDLSDFASRIAVDPVLVVNDNDEAGYSLTRSSSGSTAVSRGAPLNATPLNASHVPFGPIAIPRTGNRLSPSDVVIDGLSVTCSRPWDHTSTDASAACPQPSVAPTRPIPPSSPTRPELMPQPREFQSLVLGQNSVARRSGPGSPHLRFHPQHAGRPADVSLRRSSADETEPSVDDECVPALHPLRPLANRSVARTHSPRANASASTAGRHRPSGVLDPAGVSTVVAVPVPPIRRNPAPSPSATRFVRIGEPQSARLGGPTSLVAQGLPALTSTRAAVPRVTVANSHWEAIVRMDPFHGAGTP